MPGGNGERARSAEEVRAEIARAREEIAASMVALRREVGMRTDWRRWVRTHPGLCLTGVFMLGFWLGSRRR